MGNGSAPLKESQVAVKRLASRHTGPWFVSQLVPVNLSPKSSVGQSGRFRPTDRALPTELYRKANGDSMSNVGLLDKHLE